MPANLAGLAWLLVCVIPFILIQRWLHREIQAVFFIITRHEVLALGLFSLLFFPGVLLHEASHFLTAVLLRVPTGRFSLLPKMLPDGHLRLGYVEVSATDPVRDALIGTAPLITGGLVIAYLGASPLGIGPLAGLAAQGQWDAFGQGLLQLPARQDFYLWFYLAFAISSTMLPSASDRRAWLPMLIGAVILLAIALLVGAGPWMLDNMAPWLDRTLQAVALVFGISLALHVLLGIPVGLLRVLLARIAGWPG
jgi:hypothetical protein